MIVLSAAAGAVLAAGGCPAAPSAAISTFSNNVLSWAKWLVLALLGISFFVSLSMLIWGRVTHHPRGARLGFDGIMVCVGVAILFAAGYALIAGIAGSGCG